MPQCLFGTDNNTYGFCTIKWFLYLYNNTIEFHFGRFVCECVVWFFFFFMPTNFSVTFNIDINYTQSFYDCKMVFIKKMEELIIFLY
jgi:hypothetical protein